MKQKRHILYALALVAVLLSACSDGGRRGSISGTLTGAAGETLYLEHSGSGRPQVVDSVRLDADGRFAFRPALEAGPDFFNLRLGQQRVTLVVDTLVTPVVLRATRDGFAADYEADDALNRQLHDAARLVDGMRRDFVRLGQDYQERRLDAAAYRDTVLALMAAYKQQALEGYIYRDPSSPVSYYLLFQSVRGLVIFDPHDAQDNRAFGAVATGWLFNYPASPRVAYLERVTREGQALRHEEHRRAQRRDSLAETVPLVEANYFDLHLPNVGDRETSLSSLVDGQHVVLLDFTAYMLPASVGHNQTLHALYEQYRDRGLAIYQVCLDPDENFWKVSASRVPWTSVRDTEVLYDQEGYVQYSRPAGMYNVRNLPTTFILGRDGSIEVRLEGDKDLEAEVRKRL